MNNFFFLTARIAEINRTMKSTLRSNERREAIGNVYLSFKWDPLSLKRLRKFYTPPVSIVAFVLFVYVNFDSKWIVFTRSNWASIWFGFNRSHLAYSGFKTTVMSAYFEHVMQVGKTQVIRLAMRISGLSVISIRCYQTVSDPSNNQVKRVFRHFWLLKKPQ